MVKVIYAYISRGRFLDVNMAEQSSFELKSMT